MPKGRAQQALISVNRLKEELRNAEAELLNALKDELDTLIVKRAGKKLIAVQGVNYEIIDSYGIWHKPHPDGPERYCLILRCTCDGTFIERLPFYGTTPLPH